MGANEKHEAAMHGGQYTPATENVEHSYVAYRSSKVDLITGHHEFTRWLDRVRAEAKAEALNESATYAVEWVGVVGDGRLVDLKTENEYADTAEWLRARANQYKEAPSA